MIDDEVTELLTDRTDDGRRLNQLVDEFRRGREVSQLVVLLDSSNPELVSIGAWILCELPFELYRSDDMLRRLRGLTGHCDPAVRFHAVGALFPALNPMETSTRDLLQKLLSDPNDGVRRAAQMAASRLSLT
ncbi:HEAT repeat domain-containing protein [Pyxidicoccus parkwayensis]|uniref:HEAT repeat domain-containing protein n=1 Tax=Pyxidicoccus parkwayensis TaxID=2813578 RepID=A0ABX7NN42_9BACT|nr:HEAT repeat domain-containing protein [Pyxidicoccus parkwaysis]QSQ20279.1 HEAT repeat domain-containing protein [Pyxidicoccus parkwaysis]